MQKLLQNPQFAKFVKFILTKSLKSLFSQNLVPAKTNSLYWNNSAFLFSCKRYGMSAINWLEIFMRCQKFVSVITIARYTVIFYDFDCDLAGSTKKCPLYSVSAIDRFDCTFIFILKHQQNNEF